MGVVDTTVVHVIAINDVTVVNAVGIINIVATVNDVSIVHAVVIPNIVAHVDVVAVDNGVYCCC